jgi:Lon-like protease
MGSWATTFAMRNSTSDVDTAEPIVLPSDAPAATAVRRPPRYRWLRWAIPLSVIAALVAGSFLVTLPYYAISPGTAPEVNGLLAVPKDLNHPAQGRVLMVTVSLSRVRAIEALRGWIDKDIDVVPEEQILGPTPRKNFRQQNVQEMDDSKQDAAVVALRKLGYTVNERGAGALVTTIADKSPADGRLALGDVVTAVDGKPVQLSGDLVRELATRQYGETVRLTVVTGDKPPRTEAIRLGGSNADKSECAVDKPLDGKGCLGIVLNTKSHAYDMPINVTLDTGGIGGPSAGLAFALGIMDALRPGELTAGKKIAVTGTIDRAGQVGDVGGVVQKTAAVRASGADVFLVPAGEYEQAKAHAGKRLQVIKVATLDDALQALARLGGTI